MARPTPTPSNLGRGLGLFAALVCLSLATGCADLKSSLGSKGPKKWFNSSYEDPLVGQKMDEAGRLFAELQFKKAREIFKDVADNQRNPVDTAELARFMQAECRRLMCEYPQAVDTYNKLLMDFDHGAHRHEAIARMYEIADYWLDDFRQELDDRKAEKGVLHWRPSWPFLGGPSKPALDQEGRMLEAFDHIATYDGAGPYGDKALFWCGYVNFIRGNFNESDIFFSQLVEMHKDSPLRPHAIAYAIQAKNNSTGGPTNDLRKCAEGLQLIHQAEATVPELTQNPEMAEKLARARFAIRAQQAEKDFRTAQYYERTGHPGSAVFYYELVCRRYSGTRYSDLASERKKQLLDDIAAGKPAMHQTDPILIAEVKWKQMFGKDNPAVDPGSDPNKPDLRPVPNSPRPLPPSVGTGAGPGSGMFGGP